MATAYDGYAGNLQRELKYDRKTGEIGLYLDGVRVGFAGTWADGDDSLDALVDGIRQRRVAAERVAEIAEKE